MTFLTTKQKAWLIRKTIKAGDFYSFPPMGFTIYAEPSYSGGEYMDTNPFTKSLAGEFFLVKEKINGFCKANFYDRPKGADMYLIEEELSQRPIFEMLILLIITFLPLIIYNLCNGVVKRIELKK